MFDNSYSYIVGCLPTANNKLDKDPQKLTSVLRTVLNHPNVWEFLEPVNEDEAPDYYKIITLLLLLS